MTTLETGDGSLDCLIIGEAVGVEAALAKRHMPLLMLDEAEPYLPLAMGYTVFETPSQSLSSKFQVMPQGGPVIEYAVWYDWDIQHLYDLEHVWVYLDAQGTVVRVDASRHGKRIEMIGENGQVVLNGNRPVVFSEAGKHAHWADGAEMAKGAGVYLPAMCSDLAASFGVHEGNSFCEAGLFTPSAKDHRLAKLKMSADAFMPTFRFAAAKDADIKLVPWGAMQEWIPARVNALMADLEESVPHIAAVFFDCGDTIADENTEVKLTDSEVVVEAELIPGGADMVRRVSGAGYRIALVADGPRETFENILKPRALWELFEAHIISGDVGELKPSPKMFQSAFDAMGLEKDDAGRVVMIGNNLSRDIKGANDFGIVSVHLGWSRRRSHAPADASEVPNHVIETPTDFAYLLHDLELAMAKTAANGGGVRHA